MKTGFQELILLTKEFGFEFSKFWAHVRICIESLLTKLLLFKNE